MQGGWCTTVLKSCNTSHHEGTFPKEASRKNLQSTNNSARTSTSTYPVEALHVFILRSLIIHSTDAYIKYNNKQAISTWISVIACCFLLKPLT